MNYRICRFSGLEYQNALNQVAADLAAVGECGYDRLMSRYMAKGAVYSDAFARAMAKLGNEAREFLYDGEAAQKLWAAEHGLACDGDGWRQRIAEAQVRDFAPDVVYIQGASRGNFFPGPDFRKNCPSVRLVVGYVGSPVPGKTLPPLDLLFSTTALMCQTLADEGFPARLLYHGFDTLVPERLEAWRRAGGGGEGGAIGLSFLGSTGYGYQSTHTPRYWDLIKLIGNTGIELWAQEALDRYPFAGKLADLDALAATLAQFKRQVPPEHFAGILAEMHQAMFGTLDPQMPLSRLFPERCHPAAFGLEMYDVLQRSRVTFNRHSEFAARGYAANMRMFEATGVGTCLLTENAVNIRDLFEPGSEIVAYDGIEDCIEKAVWLLDHPDACRRIAEAGRRRTLRDHTVDRRVETIDAHIRALLAGS